MIENLHLTIGDIPEQSCHKADLTSLVGRKDKKEAFEGRIPAEAGVI